MFRSIYLGLILAILGVLMWFNSPYQPMSEKEARVWLDLVKEQEGNPGKHDFHELEAFLLADDGKPFYTVNLYHFNQQANYKDGSRSLSGLQAFEEFQREMLKQLAKVGAQPVFGSIEHLSPSPWQKLVIVRYESRRDIMKLFTSEGFVNANEHKWASLASHERLLVQGLHLPSLNWILCILLLGLLAIALLSLRSASNEQFKKPVT